MKTTTTVKDPVCGMDIDPEMAPAKAEYKGTTYYFCGVTCEEQFNANPEKYAGKTAKSKQA